MERQGTHLKHHHERLVKKYNPTQHCAHSLNQSGDFALCRRLFHSAQSDGFFKGTTSLLSQRLGLGKGGLRMTPSEALGEILQCTRKLIPIGAFSD
ncbi:hypothetical protein JHK82_035638 [Glycine max]|nr:hypothetical protein JHK85_036364 [Glycine max]KAG5112369.1 hypothetical protein JHK82_035638 [Glycine max]KAG5129648.1 hypothetical protein JHK84_036045 [Glycine max]